jgi:hypothetical protein
VWKMKSSHSTHEHGASFDSFTQTVFSSFPQNDLKTFPSPSLHPPEQRNPALPCYIPFLRHLQIHRSFLTSARPRNWSFPNHAKFVRIGPTADARLMCSLVLDVFCDSFRQIKIDWAGDEFLCYWLRIQYA